MTWLDLVGWGGSALLVFSLLQARVLRFRALNLVACVILLVFNALIEVWPMVGMNAVLAGINIWFLVRLLRDRHDETAFEVVEVGRDDAYLRHLLTVHGDDIRRYQPASTWAPATDRDHAFLVLRGDETVGVVLLDAEDDVARVRLDYVTPRFRDFTPGEFVWRDSGVLANLGFRHVMTPPDMVDAYYGRVGFRPNGREFVLDL
ncbi:YgjV family protein [Nocardioides rubriscoriae]|uniref:YgjV family protein n=1 Tax=Nocardioides rubriscoriae TaxID=642762 RepID=UPI0011E05235|nr:YgjV family protein [Nocardioides rubriscoriae]